MRRPLHGLQCAAPLCSAFPRWPVCHPWRLDRRVELPRRGTPLAIARPALSYSFLEQFQSKQKVPRAGDEYAGTTGLAPYALVGGAGFCPAVVAGMELPVVDPQLTVEQIQLLQAGMRVRR